MKAVLFDYTLVWHRKTLVADLCEADPHRLHRLIRCQGRTDQLRSEYHGGFGENLRVIHSTKAFVFAALKPVEGQSR